MERQMLRGLCLIAAGGLFFRLLPATLKLLGRTKMQKTGRECSIYVATKSFEFISKELSALKLPENAIIDDKLPDVGLGFDLEKFMHLLDTHSNGNMCFYAPRIPSTQTFISQNFHAFPIGTVCIADTQDQGKGRVGNTWVSPKGCLMFSFSLQMEDGRAVPFIQYVICLAVVEAIEAVCIQKLVPFPDVRIKWPNDIYASNCFKIGGVLCSSTYSSKKFNIVLGIGLNVDNTEPTTCLNMMIHKMDPLASPIKREELLAMILKRFEELFSVFSTEGFSPLQVSYCKRWLHSGQEIVIEDSDSSVCVVIQGLTKAGYLLAVDKEGNKYELHPDGNSLDFFKGLLKRKLTSSESNV